MMTRLAILAAALMFAALTPAAHAATPQEPIVTTPFFIDENGAINVAVTIDGRGPYNFIVDTGATITFAFENLAAIEDFPPTGGEPKRILGINGSTVRDTHRMGDVAVGSAALTDHIGVVLNDWAPPRKTPQGVLGIDFFRRYAVLFDVKNKTMSLYPHGGVPKERIERWRTVKLSSRAYANVTGKLFTASGRLNGSPVTFIIDLGSVTSLVNYEAAESIYKNILTMSMAGGRTTGSRLADVFDDRSVTRTGRFRELRIGPLLWRERIVWLTDAPIFEDLGVMDQPYGLLGLDIIAEKDFVLDFGENRLYVSR